MGRVDWDTDWYEPIDKSIDLFMERLADDVLDDMIATAPVKTGRLKEDLDKEYNTHTKVARVGAKSVPWAIWAEEGTPPHRIESKDKKALWWAGAQHPVNVVNHPGGEASHFMKNALYKERTS
jgi:hypothetical protein